MYIYSHTYAHTHKIPTPYRKPRTRQTLNVDPPQLIRPKRPTTSHLANRSLPLSLCTTRPPLPFRRPSVCMLCPVLHPPFSAHRIHPLASCVNGKDYGDTDSPAGCTRVYVYKRGVHVSVLVSQKLMFELVTSLRVFGSVELFLTLSVCGFLFFFLLLKY